MIKIFFITLIFTVSSYGFLLRPTSMYGVRPLGMGNAFLAISDDNNAFWYNPAALARMRANHGNVFDLNLGVDSMDTLSRMVSSVSTGDFSNLLRTDTQFMRLGVKPSFITRYFGISAYDEFFSFTDFKDINSLDAQADVFTYNDLGFVTAFAVPFGDYVAGGAAIRVFERTSIDASLTTQSLLDLVGLEDINKLQTALYDHLKSIRGTGWAIGLNLGTLIRVPLATKSPKFYIAFTAEDVGWTKFKPLSSNATTPEIIRMKYNCGVALRYTLSKSSELNIAADYRDYFHIGHEGTTARRINIGAEYKNDKFGVRLGIFQGYPTLGFSITTPPHTIINFATYAHELSTQLWTRQQRFYQVQLIIGFNPI